MPRMPVTDIDKKIASLTTKLNNRAQGKGKKKNTELRVLAPLADSPNTYFLRRPSGIMPLDVHTGGGLPAGGLTYLSGPDGAGKTFCLYKYFAMNQKLYGKQSVVALAATEAAPDHFFMRKCGMQVRIPEVMISERVDEKKLRGEVPFTKEQLKAFREDDMGHVEIIRGATGEAILHGMLECFKSKTFDIIGLDSVSACLPAAEAMKDLDDNAKRAAAASLLTRFFQHYLNGTTGYGGTNPTTVIFTSQVRANPDKAKPGPAAMWAPDYVAIGAWAAKHGKLIDILLKYGKKEREEIAGDEKKEDGSYVKKKQIGKRVQYEITKGKAGIHEGVTGEFLFNFATTHEQMIDPNFRLTEDQRMILVEAISCGTAQEANGFITVYDKALQPITGATKIAGMDRLCEMMRADFDLELRLRKAVLSAAGIECKYG